MNMTIKDTIFSIIIIFFLILIGYGIYKLEEWEDKEEIRLEELDERIKYNLDIVVYNETDTFNTTVTVPYSKRNDWGIGDRINNLLDQGNLIINIERHDRSK